MTVLGSLAALFCLVVGGTLLTRADTAFGAVWASLFVVVGLVVAVAFWARLGDAGGDPPPPRDATWEGEPARFLPRQDRSVSVAVAVCLLLGCWFLAMGVVGAVEENLLWPLLAAVPTVYFLGYPAFAAAGRFRAGGVWLTRSSVVDEHLGVRTEIALSDVDTVMPRSADVRVVPTAASAVSQRRLAPRPWCARTRPGEMLIAADGVAGGPRSLADELRDRAALARRG